MLGDDVVGRANTGLARVNAFGYIRDFVVFTHVVSIRTSSSRFDASSQISCQQACDVHIMNSVKWTVFLVLQVTSAGGTNAPTIMCYSALSQ
jgi:plastocyanin domain-containing protein